MANRHTILVVDDEPDVVKSVQDLLRLDYRVLGATRARAAMEIMRNDEVHVVMTDQRMPEITGVEFLRQIRGDFPEAIRLLFTGYADIGPLSTPSIKGTFTDISPSRGIRRNWKPSSA